MGAFFPGDLKLLEALCVLPGVTRKHAPYSKLSQCTVKKKKKEEDAQSIGNTLWKDKVLGASYYIFPMTTRGAVVTNQMSKAS